MTRPPLQLPSDQDSSGRDLGEAEIHNLTEVIRSGVLNSTKGTQVARFERDFASFYGSKHCVALASGSAAIHTALAAIELEPFDEVITTPITDMGAITPILYQGAVPVFADIDPFSYNVTADTIRRRLTPRTRAVIVTHLFGAACRMEPILELAKQNNLKVIEDCAQSYLAESAGRRVGTLGAIGTFSMQQGKHITTGEGGMVLTDDDTLARRMRLFVNKAWGYGDPVPDHYFLALNYRLTELQGAVASAQLSKLSGVVDKRRKAAARLDKRLAGIRGIRVPQVPKGDIHVYWKYCLDVDAQVLGFGVTEVAQELKTHGIASAPRYIQKPAFRCEVLKDRRTFGRSGWPLEHSDLAKHTDESWWRAEYPGAYQALSRILVLPWNEFYTDEHVDRIADRIEETLAKLSASSLK